MSSYYDSGDIRVIDIIRSHELDFCRGNIAKYLLRAGRKPGEPRQVAIEKAKHYCDLGSEHRPGVILDAQALADAYEQPLAAALAVELLCIGADLKYVKTLIKSIP
jgi:hypothetical protein